MARCCQPPMPARSTSYQCSTRTKAPFFGSQTVADHAALDAASSSCHAHITRGVSVSIASGSRHPAKKSNSLSGGERKFIRVQLSSGEPPVVPPLPKICFAPALAWHCTEGNVCAFLSKMQCGVVNAIQLFLYDCACSTMLQSGCFELSLNCRSGAWDSSGLKLCCHVQRI